jgi:hypothetical protein
VGTILGTIGSMIVGGVVASVTIVGLVSSSVNTSSDTPGDINAPASSQIDYGSGN